MLPAPCPPSFAPFQRRLVLARSGLASLQLLQVPVANLHVAAIVVHALGELLRSGLAVVAPLLLLLGGLGLHRLRRGLRRAAREEAADGMADR